MVSSLAGKTGVPFMSSVSASKFALHVGYFPILNIYTIFLEIERSVFLNDPGLL